MLQVYKLIITATYLQQTRMSRRPKTYILDQDQHLENLRKIIKRDYFETDAKQKQNQDAIPLSLNDYLKNFKSNENQIFTELVYSHQEEWKKKFEWMEKTKHLMLEGQKKQRPFSNMLQKDPHVKGIDCSIVKQEAKNAVFFSPSRETNSYNDSQHEKAKKINTKNCRIDTEQLHRAQIYRIKNIVNPNLQQIPSTPVLQGRKLTKSKNSQIDYSLKRAPSPEPQNIPIITWGEIESTPLRVDSEPQYKIPEKSARDSLLEELNAKITKQKLIKKEKKEDLKIKILSSMRPSGNSSYRKVSVARQTSEKRSTKEDIIKGRLEGLLKERK